MRLYLIGEEREAETCRVELESVGVAALQALEARVGAVAVVVSLLTELDLEPFLPALLSAGMTISGGEHSQVALTVAAACLAQLER